MWIIDFGIDMAEDEAALYEMPFEYVRAAYAYLSDKNRRADFRGTLVAICEAPPRDARGTKGRQALHCHPACLQASSLRLGTFGSAVPTSRTIVFARDDDYFFGVLHSRVHELWARRMGTQLREAESGCRYTPTTTFETFPFPWPPGREPADDPRVQAIAAAAADLVAKRDAWLNPTGASDAERKQRTLTNLYNARPAWLDLAHRALDAAVLAAYGWPKDLTDDEILARLLALNLERAGKGVV